MQRRAAPCLLLLAGLLLLLRPAAAQSGVAAELLAQINQIRRGAGLQTLSYNWQMNAAAARHSSDMAGHSMLSHTGSDGSRHSDRLRVAGGGGFSCTAENVAYVSSGAKASEVVTMWMNSDGHRKNMLNARYSAMGAARASSGGRDYFTLVLGGMC